MIETCPRCSTRLGPPLTSGRQVCVECGWSSAPAASRQTATGTARQKKQPSALKRVFILCWRIIKRTSTYIFLLLRTKAKQFQQSQTHNKVQPGQLVQGLTERLSALESAIPTSVERQTQSWMTLEDAFRMLGGDPSNPKSYVKTLNGEAALSFSRFCRLRSDHEFRAFGLEHDWTRRNANRPWLRPML